MQREIARPVEQATSRVDRDVAVRARWRAVALPSEHGGWGLTLEPVLLGLLVAWSVAGLVLGLAGLTAFLLRTPAKLVAVDVRRERWLDRTRLALRIAIVETMVLGSSVAVAIVLAGWTCLAPLAVAGPLVVVQLFFDVRSRGRRLVPELCGAVGIASVVSSIVLAAGRSGTLAAGVWLVLAARAIGAVPFVRVQIVRLRRGVAQLWQSDVAQAVSLTVAATAVVVDRRLLFGLIGVAALAAIQTMSVRRAPQPAKRVGVRQMAMGLGLVAVTAAGVLW